MFMVSKAMLQARQGAQSTPYVEPLSEGVERGAKGVPDLQEFWGLRALDLPELLGLTAHCSIKLLGQNGRRSSLILKVIMHRLCISVNLIIMDIGDRRQVTQAGKSYKYLRRLLALPEVDVMRQLAACSFLCVQDYVGITWEQKPGLSAWSKTVSWSRSLHNQEPMNLFTADFVQQNFKRQVEMHAV